VFRIILGLIILVAIAGCGKEQATASKSKSPLICHVGGTMRPLIAKLAKLYEDKTGQKISINSAGSGELLAHIELMQVGDIYVCHDPFLDLLMKKQLGIDGWVIAELFPVIIVQKGNPKKITGLKDFTRDDIEIFLTDYKHSSLGRMLPTIFSKAGIDFKQLVKQKNIHTNKSGSYVGNMIKLKNADVAIVWKVVAELRANAVEQIYIDNYLPVPFVDMVTGATGKAYKLTPMRVTVATLKCSTQPTAAAKFAQFLTSATATKALTDAGYKANATSSRAVYKNGTACDDH
jgi:molybdate transport system substrate-binding protein